MSFPAYPSYQDSGVDWLGEVPDHWRVTRLKRACSIFASNVDKKSVEGQNSVRLCNYTDVYYNDLIEAALPFMEATATREQIDRFSLKAGDTIITKDSESPDDIARSAYVPFTLPGVVCGYHLSMVRPFPTTNGEFLKRYFDSAHARGYFHTSANGLTRFGLGQYSLDNAPIALPPLAEQIAIAAFLDRETAKIDALIEEQRRLIALLKEKQQAVISHAVTKGINPHAPMKDSGIEWLGEVPVHWRVAPLKRAANVIAGFAFSANAFSLNGNHWRLLRGINLSASGIRWNGDTVYWERSSGDGLDAWELRTGDIVLGMDRPWVGGGLRVAAIAEEDLPCLLLQRVAAVRAECSAAQRFILHCLRHEAFYHHCAPEMTGVSVPHISGGQIEEFRMPLPPADEMDAIAQHIDDRAAELAALIEVAQSATSLLNERRAALISAAVTGKIDVRGSAKVLPFPVDRTRARGLIATEIIERSAHQATFGRVKFQKIAFLAEAHVGINELEGCYTRQAAGPLDRALIEEMESGARSIAEIEHEQPGGSGTTVSYRLGGQRGAHRQELADWLGPDRTAKLDKLITVFANLTTKQAEAVATLYGVWNDTLSESASPTDDEIISGFLNDWHPEKRVKFRTSELPEWLGWMRRNGIVPTGSGPKTTIGRLFV